MQYELLLSLMNKKLDSFFFYKAQLKHSMWLDVGIYTFWHKESHKALGYMKDF